MEFFSDIIIPVITLSFLEIVLGIDNIVLISIISAKLPESQQEKARIWGLGIALIMRIALLFTISWFVSLTDSVINIDSLHIHMSIKDIILLAGGGFLIYKSVTEIFEKTEGHDSHKGKNGGKVATMKQVLLQIMIMDMVFSLDSVITAVGMVDNIWIMVTAVIIAIIIMMIAVNPISTFIEDHLSFKILALCFMLLIGFTLSFEAFHYEIEKSAIYSAMGFAFLVDFIQMWYASRNNNKITA